MCFFGPTLTSLSFHSQTRQGPPQESERYGGGVELPQLLEPPLLLLSTDFPVHAADENVQNVRRPLRSQRGHKGEAPTSE